MLLFVKKLFALGASDGLLIKTPLDDAIPANVVVGDEPTSVQFFTTLLLAPLVLLKLANQTTTALVPKLLLFVMVRFLVAAAEFDPSMVI